MLAQVVRRERFGRPDQAFRIERVETPIPREGEVLVRVMAAGINYNNVWAATGVPLDVTRVHERYDEPSDFHIGGSDGAGIVQAVGPGVDNVAVGDHVVIHCAKWDPAGLGGEDPCFSSSYHIWGYESNYGSFAEYTRVQAHQCMPKAPHLSWEEAAAPTLVGATALRMLMGWPPNTVEPGDPVLIWGGAGGLGCMAIQIVRAFGGRPIAVVSSEERAQWCLHLGAEGVIDRKQFSHWGLPPHWTDEAGSVEWTRAVRKFGAKIWEILGERRNPRIVVEHPGELTIPTSLFVCDSGGMVVVCAGTTGYHAVADLRRLWMRQKRFQGSHFANGEQCHAFNELVLDGRVEPCLSRTFEFEDIGVAHQLMSDNEHPSGNMAALVGAPRPGLGRTVGRGVRPNRAC